MMQFHRYRSVWEHEELLGRLGRIRHVALDMDGSIYMCGSLFPWTGAFLSELRELGMTEGEWIALWRGGNENA